MLCECRTGMAATISSGSGGLPKVAMDSGGENINREVDGLVSADLIRRISALVQVNFDNSIVDAFWRSDTKIMTPREKP